MTDFRRALARLRREDGPPGFSISEQLRFLPDSPRRRPSEHRSSGFGGGIPQGRVAENGLGSHYLIRSVRDDDHSHGKVRLARMSVDDLRVLLGLAGCGTEGLERRRIVFLDTETTGVSGGAGMCPFLVGLGYYSEDGFEVLQYFIRDFDEEASMLDDLRRKLSEFDFIVTYNGRTFDLPLLENRFVLSRLESPLGRLTHFDLLFTARRLWRAGHGSCRLTALEERLVGFGRGPDIPGALIPRAYFDYVHYGEATALRSVFSHNVYDILSLAALTIVAADRVVTPPAPLDDPLDVFSLARVFDRARDRDRSKRYYEQALRSAMPAPIRTRAMERLAVLCRRAGEHERSMELCDELIGQGEFSLAGYEGASIFYERTARDLASALGVLEEALRRVEGIPRMAGRRARLESRRARLRKKLAAVPGELVEAQPQCAGVNRRAGA